MKTMAFWIGELRAFAVSFLGNQENGRTNQPVVSL